jgi:ketosteroid isomerase-like protein
VGRPGGDVTQAEYDGIVTALAEDAIVTSNQKLEINAKRNNAVGFGGLAAGGEVKYDFNDRVARIMSYGDEQ